MQKFHSNRDNFNLRVMIELIEVLKDYDLPTIIVIFAFYHSINKKVNTVDRAINNVPTSSFEVSKELIGLTSKLEVLTIEVKHVKKEVDAHRSIDEKTFEIMAKDITSINERLYHCK